MTAERALEVGTAHAERAGSYASSAVSEMATAHAAVAVAFVALAREIRESGLAPRDMIMMRDRRIGAPDRRPAPHPERRIAQRRG